MKIIYYSQTFFADCDFPLVRELQNRGHDVRYYLPITSFNKCSTLINIKRLYPHTGIFPASIYPEFEEYKNDIDISKLYVVNQRYKQKLHPINLWLYFKLAIHFIIQKADIIHCTIPPTLSFKTIYLAKKKLVLTLHDPILHSSRGGCMAEWDRKHAFKNIKKLILLNTRQVDKFKAIYKIPDSHIFFSKLGIYDSIVRVKSMYPKVNRPFILFFGLISPYKGLEYLMKSMLEVHKSHPDITLVVAGRGNLYFDMKPYKNLDYIQIMNHYIPMAELAGLLKECLFVVCPYKDATQSGVIQTAFSLNVPVIVTNAGALSEVVHDNETGLVVPMCNVEALTCAIIKLLTEENLRDSMRHKIETFRKRNMSWNTIASQYEKCYRSKNF